MLRGVAWAVITLTLVSVAFYVGLLVHRKVSPPAVPIDRANHVIGYSTGDVVLLRDVTGATVKTGDIVAARTNGSIVVGQVGTIDQSGSTVTYHLGGAHGPEPVAVTTHDLVGRVDRRLPLLGWLLLAARNPGLEILAGMTVVGFIVLLVFGSGTPLDFLDDESEPAELFPSRILALPAGPSVKPPPPMPYVERPMSITPDDLRQVRFAFSRKGYDTEAVDRALDTVADSLEAVLQERQQLIERLRAMEADVERYKAMEGQLGQTLAMAERSAEQVRAEAHAEAQRILAEAQSATPTGGSPSPQDGTMVELLGETRAIRSLLQAVLAQGSGFPPPQAPPQY